MNIMATKGLWYIVLVLAVLLQKVISVCQPKRPKGNNTEINENNNKSNASGVCGVNPSSCNPSAFRSYDGSCNNLLNPEWGSVNYTYQRFLEADFEDGKNTPRKSCLGIPLPSARKLSTTFYPSRRSDDSLRTLISMYYGQIIAQDMSSEVSVNNKVSCCSPDRKLLTSPPDECYSIEVPLDDPIYAKYNVTCLPFTRPLTDDDLGCRGNRERFEQITPVSSFLDLSIIYGNSDIVNKQVRLFVGGKLRTNFTNGQEMLPTSSNPNNDCFSFNGTSLPCYFTGDKRVNENPNIAILHTLLTREHNRIADKLYFLNPHWNDERVFQESRKINIAQHQHISYYEWMPLFLGSSNIYTNKLLSTTTGFVNDYNASVNATIYNEHATASNRYFTTFVQGQLTLMNELRLTKSTENLSNNFFSPHLLEKNSNSFDDLTRGMCTQPMDGADAFHTSEITSNWLKQPGSNEIGQDLKSIDIQRGRAHGLASYNDYRKLCGLNASSTFQGFRDHMSLSNVLKLEELYEIPEDVDLIVGASLETIEPGTVLGLTNTCIMTKQFYKTRVGDRFWYENSGSTGFSLPQLTQIRKATISRLICDNTNIGLMQSSGFTKISLINPLVACALLPSVDYSLWKEYSNISTTTTASGFVNEEDVTDSFY